MNKSKRKLLITMLVMMFVLLSAVAVVAIAFSLTQQTITTTLNITYTVEDIIGSVKAEYTIGSSTTSLTAYKNGTAQGSELIFDGNETSSDSFSLEFPQELTLTKANPEVIIKYTYANDGPVHYIASMDLNTTTLENMNVSYSIDGTDYSTNRYAVVVPANSSNKSYWIKISIANTALNASLSGEFSWFLDDCDASEIGEAYKSLTSLTFEATGTEGEYMASVSSSGDYAGRLVFPSEVNGTPVTKIVRSSSLTQEQKDQITSVFIPASVTEIGMGAFQKYTNLQEVIFEEGSQLTTIDQYGFIDCTSLTSITIPASITDLGDGRGGPIFSGCNNLIKLEVNSANKTYHSADNCIIKTATNTLILGCKTSVIPTDGSVTKIDMGAFYKCSGLTNIIIPNSVTTISMEAFRDCIGLTNITIPDSVTYLDSFAFAGCTNLTSVTFENPNGWACPNSDKSFTAEELSDPTTAATYLTTTYTSWWKRS